MFCVSWSGSKLFAKVSADKKDAASKERVNQALSVHEGRDFQGVLPLRICA